MSELTRRIDSIIGQAKRLVVKMPTAIDALLDQRRRYDGYTTGAGVFVTASSEHTTTEAAALGRIDHIDRTITNMYAELDAAQLILRNLCRDCDRAIADVTPPPPPKPRCDGGTGYRGHNIAKAEGGWSNPGCHNIPREGKTCDDCEMAAAKWARRNPKQRYEHEQAG